MKHKRWTEEGFFPANKYSFSEHLTRVGDFVVTHPLDKKDRKRFLDAAYMWAWSRQWKVSCKSKKVALDKWEVRCMLVSKKAGREFI